MEENISVLKNFLENFIANPYSSFLNSLPERYQLILNVFVYVVLISIYAIFVFEFYRFLARKNILSLNLSQYNKSTHPSEKKFFAALFFLVEYIIILPILVFFWFIILAFLLLLLSKDQPLEQILLMSAAIVGAVRVTSYFREGLSRDLAKIVPFTALVIFLLSPNFLDFKLVLDKLVDVPLFLNHIFSYLIFIVSFEILIRAVYTIIFLCLPPEEQEEEEIEEAMEE